MDANNNYSKSALDFFEKVVSEELIRKKIEEAKIEYSHKKIQETKMNRLSFLRKLIQKLLPDNIKQAIHFYFSLKHKKSIYKVSLSEKKFSLDFLNYILKNNPDIPYSYFPKEDWGEIKQFVRNKFLLSISDSIPREKIFSKKDFLKQRYYEDFLRQHKIKKEGNYYEFLGFKSTIPYFEPSIFIEKYGIEYFRNKVNILNSTIIDCGGFCW